MRFLFLNYRGIQQACTVYDAENVNGIAGDSKYNPILSDNEMTIAGSEDFIFGNKRTTTGPVRKCLDSFLKFENEPICTIHAVRCDVGPDLIKIDLCSSSDLNLKSFAHS